MCKLRGLSANITDQFSPEEIIDVNSRVDDCACGCASHFTVKDGLIHVHGRPIFDKLLIEGDLFLHGDANLQRLPDLLAVTGSVHLSDCINLRIMPSRMYVGLDVHMERTKVRDLPETMIVAGAIYADECPDLIEIPAGVSASAVLAPACPSLTKVAPNLEFSTLDLSRGAIASLPAGLTIANELRLVGCSHLTSIEEGVSVGGLIDVTGCDRLFTLPRSVQAKIVITDGMLFAMDCMVLPKMSETEAAMCLGFEAIRAFPHHHLKNVDGMQSRVKSIEHKLRSHSSARTFAILESNSRHAPDNERFAWLNSRLNNERVKLMLKHVGTKRLT